MTDLLKNYNTQNRPVINESSPIVITFGVTLQQIVDLVGITVVTITTSDLFLQDEKNQLLTTCMWFNLDWSDYQVFPLSSKVYGILKPRAVRLLPAVSFSILLN